MFRDTGNSSAAGPAAQSAVRFGLGLHPSMPLRKIGGDRANGPLDVQLWTLNPYLLEPPDSESPHWRAFDL